MQSYHASFSYIILRSDFQANGLQRVRLLTEAELQYSTLMLSSRRKNIKWLRLEKIFEIRIFSDSLNYFRSNLIYLYTHGISFPENTPCPQHISPLKKVFERGKPVSLCSRFCCAFLMYIVIIFAILLYLILLYFNLLYLLLYLEILLYPIN